MVSWGALLGRSVFVTGEAWDESRLSGTRRIVVAQVLWRVELCSTWVLTILSLEQGHWYQQNVWRIRDFFANSNPMPSDAEHFGARQGKWKDKLRTIEAMSWQMPRNLRIASWRTDARSQTAAVVQVVKSIVLHSRLLTWPKAESIKYFPVCSNKKVVSSGLLQWTALKHGVTLPGVPSGARTHCCTRTEGWWWCKKDLNIYIYIWYKYMNEFLDILLKPKHTKLHETSLSIERTGNSTSPRPGPASRGSIWLAGQAIRCHPSTGSDTVDLHKRSGSLAMLQKLQEMHLKEKGCYFCDTNLQPSQMARFFEMKHFGTDMWMCVKCNKHGKERVRQNPEALFISRQLWSKGVWQNAAWVHRQLGDLLRSGTCLRVWQISKVNEHGTWLSSF